MSSPAEDLFSEAIVVLEAKQRRQHDSQTQQGSELENIKARLLLLEDNDNIKRIRQVIDVSTNVAMMRLEDKINEGKEKLQELHRASNDQMNTTII